MDLGLIVELILMPQIHDKDKKNDRKYKRFRMDVRIRREKYEMLKQECQLLHVTPSAKVRELVDQWVERRMNNKNVDANDEWELFIEKMKAEGFKTPEEWIKAKLGI